MTVSLAKACIPNLKKMWDDIVISAFRHNLPRELVAALIVRETSALPMYCLPPPQGKLGDGGNAAGPCQIDIGSFPEWHAAWAAGQLTTADGIDKGCEVLVEKLKEVEKAVPQLTDEVKTRLMVAGYNAGTRRCIKTYLAGGDPDMYTTGKNYSKDVLEMATFLRSIIFDLNP